MTTNNNPALRERRDQILNRLEARLRQDGRVLAAWLSGSTALGTEDKSDID